MNLRRTKIVALMTGGLLLLGAGTAFAGNGAGARDRDRLHAGCVGQPVGGAQMGPGARGIGAIDMPAVASEFLGVSEEELLARLADGETLAEIAVAEGKSVAGLVDALVSAHADMLQEAVDDGVITQAQADLMLERIQERVELMVQGTIGPRGGGFGPGAGAGPGNGPGGGPRW